MKTTNNEIRNNYTILKNKIFTGINIKRGKYDI